MQYVTDAANLFQKPKACNTVGYNHRSVSSGIKSSHVCTFENKFEKAQNKSSRRDESTALINHFHLFECQLCNKTWYPSCCGQRRCILRHFISLHSFLEIWRRYEKLNILEMIKGIATGGFLKMWKYGPLRAKNLNAEGLPPAPPSGLSHVQPMWTICRDAENEWEFRNWCLTTEEDFVSMEGLSQELLWCYLL